MHTFVQVSDLMEYFKYKYFSAKRLPQPPVIPASNSASSTLAVKLHQRINRDGQTFALHLIVYIYLTMTMPLSLVLIATLTCDYGVN